MLDRNYFEQVLPDQLRVMERPVRLTLHLSTGDQYMVHAILAAHDHFVIVKVYTEGKPAQHSKRWQANNPDLDPEIFDQVAVPYHAIAFGHLTARSTKGDDARGLIGFQEGS